MLEIPIVEKRITTLTVGPHTASLTDRKYSLFIDPDSGSVFADEGHGPGRISGTVFSPSNGPRFSVRGATGRDHELVLEYCGLEHTVGVSEERDGLERWAQSANSFLEGKMANPGTALPEPTVLSVVPQAYVAAGHIPAPTPSDESPSPPVAMTTTGRLPVPSGSRPDVAALADRESDAFLNFLMSFLQPKIYLACLRIMRNTHIAEEATQDTLMKIVQNCPPGSERRRDPQAHTGWFLAFAVNISRNMLRNVNRSKLGRVDYERLAPTLGVADDGVRDVDRRDDISTYLPLVLEQLELAKDHQREAVYLRYYFGLSDSQIADSMCRPVGTVKASIHRTLKEIRYRLSARSIILSDT